MLTIHELFSRHQLEWTTCNVGRYNEEMVVLRLLWGESLISARQEGSPSKHAPFKLRQSQRQAGWLFLISHSEVSLWHGCWCPEFPYRLKLIKEVRFQRELELRETTKWWIAQYFSVVNEDDDWLLEPKGCIKKASLTFTAMFLLILVRHWFSSITANNIVTWDRALLMAPIIAGFEVDFA